MSMTVTDQWLEAARQQLDRNDQAGAIHALIAAVNNLDAPTVKESLTVAPDPGPGWRLIDKEKDKPQGGDEVWIRQWHHWYKRGYQLQTAPFAEGYHYRRRVEVVTKEPETDLQGAKTEGREVATKPAIPAGLPPLPEGAVYLGVGGTFKAPSYFYDYWYYEISNRWVFSDSDCINEPTIHYAAPADSEVARLNGLGPTLEDEQERVKKLGERYEELDEAAQLRKQVSTLTKERDALREELNAERMRIKAIREAIGSFNNVIHMTNAAKKEASNG